MTFHDQPFISYLQFLLSSSSTILSHLIQSIFHLNHRCKKRSESYGSTCWWNLDSENLCSDKNWWLEQDGKQSNGSAFLITLLRNSQAAFFFSKPGVRQVFCSTSANNKGVVVRLHFTCSCKNKERFFSPRSGFIRFHHHLLSHFMRMNCHYYVSKPLELKAVTD